MNYTRAVGILAAFEALLLTSACGYSVPLYARSRIPASYSAEVRAANSPQYTPPVREEAAPATPKVARSSSSSVTVAKGDTVYALSRRYNVPIRSMIEINGLRPPFLLTPGQQLRLPQTAEHVVAKGDTIYSISRRYSVDMSSLARHNKISWPYSIYPGQVLSLPGAIVTAKQQTVTSWKQVPSKAVPKKKSSTSKPLKRTTSKKAKVSARKSKVRLPAPPSRSKGKFAWPLKGKVITRFGSAGAGRHNDGINIKVAEGTYVRAAENGVVAYAGNELKGFGNLLLVKHADGWMTAYAHNKEFLVKRGQTVKRGQVMAKAGRTGNVKEAQLHFEVRRGTKAVDPIAYLETP